MMRRSVIISIAALAAACDHPPVKEIAAAEAQVERARIEHADHYAPERYSEAVVALDTARTRLRERSYQAALSAANDAAESARIAMAAVEPARAAERQQAEVAMVEVRTMLDRASAERNAALEAGVPKATLASLSARGERAAARLHEVGKVLNAGSPGMASSVLADLRTEVTPLPDLFRDARTQWEAKHARVRPRKASGRPSR